MNSAPLHRVVHEGALREAFQGVMSRPIRNSEPSNHEAPKSPVGLGISGLDGRLPGLFSKKDKFGLAPRGG
jgi:hypothetical protein